jgi:hypothetical protein
MQKLSHVFMAHLVPSLKSVYKILKWYNIIYKYLWDKGNNILNTHIKALLYVFLFIKIYWIFIWAGVVKHLPGIHDVLGSMPSTRNINILIYSNWYIKT